MEDLEQRFRKMEDEKNAQVKELESEVTDLMKHLEMQAAISSADGAVKEVGY